MPFISLRAREARQATGRKIPEFAAAVGISSKHLDNAENGRRPVSIEVAYRIANELKLPVNELIEYRKSA